MANVNRVILSGNLTNTPVLKSTNNGTQVTDLPIAVNRYYRTGDSEMQQETTYVDITVFGKQAEIAAKYLTKGRKIFIEGRLHLDQWVNNDNEKRRKLKVIGEKIEFSDNNVDSDSN